MEWAILFLGTAFLVVALLMLWRGLGKAKGEETEPLRREMEALRYQLDERLDRVTQQVGERLEGTTRVVSDLRESLGRLEGASQRLFEVVKDIASLQDILRAPKLRGELGELLLHDFLSQVLPSSHFHMPHQFKNGTLVDAAIHLASGIVPVDAKFPLESFKAMLQAPSDEDRRRARRDFTRDVRRHIDTITSKYILPEEGTFDFALMYIPAENVYYETMIKEELSAGEIGLASYALSRRVIPVSPSTFYAYLQAIVLGLKGLKMEESAREILDSVVGLARDFERFRGDFQTLGTHLTHAQTKYADADKKLTHFEDKLERLGGIEAVEQSSSQPSLPHPKEE
jgi:DNA recombination protein RmuC